MRKLFSILMVSTSILLAGCIPPSRSSEVYGREQTMKASMVDMGVVTALRPVRIEGTKSPVGGMGGAVIGAIGGSTIGGGRGSAVASVLGAIAGGLAGAAIEEGATTQNGVEITVRLDNNGRSLAVVQAADEVFQLGDRVRVLSNPYETRISH